MKIFLPLLDNGNGSVMSSFMMDHIAAFKGRNVLMMRAADSHANRGMNKIANAFLDTDCDVWINIDADIRFRKMDIDNLLSHPELPLVYGIYPKKDDGTDPCLCTFATVEPDAKGMAEVRRSGRGFMLVKRELLEMMKEDNGGPALRYHNHVHADQPEKIEWDFFTSGPVEGAFSALDPAARKNIFDKDGYPIREWISEDWMFCERARELGVKTFVDTNIALGHIGLKAYYFSGNQVVRMDSNITCWQNIHGWFDYENLYRQLAKELTTNEHESTRIFVEVGCWLGRSIGAMAEFTRGSGVELHVVDTFQGKSANLEHHNILEAHGGNVEKAFRANMAALKVEVAVHAKPSVEAATEFEDGSLDVVFIDGDHREEFVREDIAAWLPKVRPGGILCGHDIDEAGVSAAVSAAFPRYEHVGRCWLVRKPRMDTNKREFELSGAQAKYASDS